MEKDFGKHSETDIRREKEIPLVPKWHDLRFAEGEPVSGEILLSLSVSKTEYSYVFEPEFVNLRDKVERRDFGVDMLILGLRELESPGILPVKKAFISFNIKSLVPPNSSAI